MRPGIPEQIALADAVAVIDEARCIGCTLCIAACPVDAIAGAAKLMHTVIASICTGCELCIAPCPVDCITLRSTPRPEGEARREALAAAHRRCAARNARLERADSENRARAAARRVAAAERRKRDTIARAVERARLRLQGGRG